MKRLALAVRKSYEVTIPTSWSSSTTGRHPIPDLRIVSIASSVGVVDVTLIGFGFMISCTVIAVASGAAEPRLSRRKSPR